jgi:hypothetical protein
VYVLYTTVVVDAAGVTFFSPDLYGHDATLSRVLGLPIRPRVIAGGRSPESEEFVVGKCLTDVD